MKTDEDTGVYTLDSDLLKLHSPEKHETIPGNYLLIMIQFKINRRRYKSQDIMCMQLTLLKLLKLSECLSFDSQIRYTL